MCSFTRFSEKYKEPHAYLVMKNYSRDPKLLKDVLNLIATISNIISTRGKKNTSINHYLDKHDGVPLWVLVGYFTLGNFQSLSNKCIIFSIPIIISVFPKRLVDYDHLRTNWK